MGGQYRECEDRVAKPTLENALAGFSARNPADDDIRFFFGAIENFRTRTQAAGLEDPNRLVAAARRGEEGAEFNPLRSDQVGFFFKFPLGRGQLWLSGNIEQPRRDLPVAHANRMAILLDEENLVGVIGCENCDRTVVVDEIPRKRVPVVVQGFVSNVPDPAVKGDFRSEDLRMRRLIG